MIYQYPRVLSEDETIERAANRSMSRFGDGELRLATGRGSAISQSMNVMLQKELQSILADKGSECLVCIPNVRSETPKRDVWDRYIDPFFVKLYKRAWYGSSFVTRPDSAPWIDRPDYWNKVQSLWRGRDVALLSGGKNGLKPEELVGANVKMVMNCPDKNAFEHISLYEEGLRKFSGTILMSAGAAATILAHRLAKRDVHALDLGHIGMFMRHQGIYVDQSSLISPEYRRANQALHADPRGFGGDGKKHSQEVEEFAKALKATSILDYGCGQGSLKRVIRFKGYFGEYDPAIAGKDALPKPADLVVCTDVLEHIEPDKLDNVLAHLRRLSAKGCFLVIATRAANKILPDGRNAHLIIEPAEWWVTRVTSQMKFRKVRFAEKKKGDGSPHEVRIWLSL